MRFEPIHNAIDYRILSFVLETEVDVSARDASQRHDLSLYPDVTRGAFHRAPQDLSEIMHADDFGVRGVL